MTYAGERVIFDADSHLMELPDFLSRHADPEVRDLLPAFDQESLKVEGVRFAEGMLPERNPEQVASLMALGDRITHGPKWHDALGSFSGPERGKALDLLGFERQVIFSSFCSGKVFQCEPHLQYAAARAHNRAMAEFCGADRRLMGVAMVPLDDPDQAVAEIRRSIEDGLAGCRHARRAAVRRGTRCMSQSGICWPRRGCPFCCT